MSGEKEQRPSGWTTDTLHALFGQAQMEATMRLEQRFQSQGDALNSALVAAEQRRIEESVFNNQIRTEADHRYEQRFVAQERALEAALITQKAIITEVNSLFGQVMDERDQRYSQLAGERDERYDHRFLAQERITELTFSQVRSEVLTAFIASDKAINKAEVATEKRFEGVNEFRAQLADQATSFIPRTEAEARISAAMDLIQSLQATSSNQITREESDRLTKVSSDKIDSLAGRLSELALDGRGYSTKTDLNDFQNQLTGVRESMMPRQEGKLLFDGLANQIATVQRTTTDLGSVVVGLRASLAGQGAGVDEATEAALRTRNTITTVVAIVVSTLAIIVSLFIGLRNHSTPATTTTTNTTPTTTAVTK